MISTLGTRAQEYIGRVDQLYALAERASRSSRFSAVRRPVHLNEEAVGEYDVDELTLSLEGRVLARLVPVGASILGALGRVDIKGEFGEETLLYLRAGDPQRQMSVAVAPDISPSENSRSYQFFRNIDEDGWYWVESVRLGRAKRVTPDLLVDLIAAVN